MLADVGDLALVDDEVVIDDREPFDAVPIDQMGQLNTGAGAAAVLDPGLARRAERARERAAAGEHHVGHRQVPAGEPVRQHDVLDGYQVPGGQREAVNVPHQRTGPLPAGMVAVHPPGAGDTGNDAAAVTGPVKDLQDGLLGLALTQHVPVEVEQGLGGVEVGVYSTDHHQGVVPQRAAPPGLQHDPIGGGGGQAEPDHVIAGQVQVGPGRGDLGNGDLMPGLLNHGGEVENPERWELLAPLGEAGHVIDLGIQQDDTHDGTPDQKPRTSCERTMDTDGGHRRDP